MNVSEPQLAPVRTLRPVFVLAATVVCTFALLVALFPLDAGRILLDAQTWASRNVGWYYLLAMTLYLVFVLGVALSSYGNIKLGADHDEPEFSYLSWAGMLFAAGISITLFFFCVSEPLTHYLQPPQGGTGNGEASARQAMQLLFLHWGLHGWGVFALAAMALAYFAFRHNLPLALRSALYPLIGKRINGPIGYTVDALGIVATVFGLGADMGFGVLHLNAGLATLFNVPHTHWVQVALIVAMMGAAILVAVSGVEKGVRWMSDINMLLAIALLLFMLFAGPTQYLLNALMQNLGDYLGSVVGKSFDVYAYGVPRLARQLDGVLLGVVDWLGALRGAVHCSHLAWPHHPRIRAGRVVDPVGIHAGVAVDLRQQRARSTAAPRASRLGTAGHRCAANGAVFAAAGLPVEPRGHHDHGGDQLRVLRHLGRLGHGGVVHVVFAWWRAP